MGTCIRQHIHTCKPCTYHIRLLCYYSGTGYKTATRRDQAKTHTLATRTLLPYTLHPLGTMFPPRPESSKTEPGYVEVYNKPTATVPAGHCPSETGTTCFWSINRVMARGACFDSISSCIRFLLEMERVYPFLGIALPGI